MGTNLCNGSAGRLAWIVQLAVVGSGCLRVRMAHLRTVPLTIQQRPGRHFCAHFDSGSHYATVILSLAKKITRLNGSSIVITSTQSIYRPVDTLRPTQRRHST